MQINTPILLSTGFDALNSFDRINVGSTLLQSAVVLGFAATLEGVSRHFGRPAMREISIVWRLFALAAVLNILSSWSGAVWNERTLSRTFTTLFVACLAACIPYVRNAARALEMAEAPLPGARREAGLWWLGALSLHALGVFGSALLWPDARVITVTWSRVIHLVVLSISPVVVWHAWRSARVNRAALQLLAVGLSALAVRQVIRVLLGLRVGLPDLPFGMVIGFVTFDVLAVTVAGVCCLLATTAEEVTLINEQALLLSRARDRVAASERMESLGRMAAALAHDMNNVLQVVSMSVEQLRDDTPAPLSAELLRDVESATQHGQSLTSQLLLFARAGTKQSVRFDAAERLHALSAMLRSLAGPGLETSVTGDPGTACLVMDPAQFEQIVVNLVANARDAVQAGGRISVTLDLVTITLGSARGATLDPGEYVRLVVADTGTGIPAEVRDHIFEPFFTTKSAGRGTGLGLATVHGITRQASGDIVLESKVGHGTTFEVLLPAA